MPRSTVLKTLILPAALAATAALSAAPAAAQAIDDKYWIEASVFRPAIDSSATVSRPGSPGTNVDFESDLDLDDTDNLFAAAAGARFGRFVLLGEYYALDRDASTTVSRSFVFDNLTVPVNAQVDSQFESNVYRATLGYSFIQNQTTELGAAVGLHATDFDLGLQAEFTVGGSPTMTTQTRRRDFLAPLPTVGLYGTYQPSPRIAINGRIDYMALGYGDYSGGIMNATATVSYRLTDMFEVGAAWRYVSYDLEVDKDDYSLDLDYSFNGPSIFARLVFR